MSRRARNTAIFSAATGLSRVAGLAREVLAAAYFGTGGPISAFTIAFQVPNVVRSLFADSALSAAFVPVFTELLEENKKREAFRLASTLFLLILLILTAITLLFVATAGLIMPLFTGDFGSGLSMLTTGLSRVLFPIVIILGVNGLVVGILNAYDHFTIPALSPLVWNAVIMLFLVGGQPLFSGDDELYAYAFGVLAGTLVQFWMSMPVLRKVGFQFEFSMAWRDPRVRGVFMLMLPVTIGLGLININLLVNSLLGALISENAPRAIDAAFRIYMLPQGMFSVAIATILFPALSRYAARKDLAALRALCSRGVRLILLLLLPAAAATLALAEPITRLVYERGEFDANSTELVKSALFWFSFSLPTSGINLLLTRTFFSLQRPWLTTALAGLNITVNIAVSAALYKPLGIAGIVIGTGVSSLVMVVAQAYRLRDLLGGGLEARETLSALIRMLVAAAMFGGVAYGVWAELDGLLGRSLIGQTVSVGTALTLATGAYVAVVLALRVGEAEQLSDQITSRLRRRRA
ncbi:MAG TPA: murein biosynthesis integral membrane protein MurJ [Baekduia sp.]|nr:murein biosynthesis integral membrane protein MurJ [Baekduia sp.]